MRLPPYRTLWIVLILLACLIGASTVLAQSEGPRPDPAVSYGAEGVTIDLLQPAVPQGHAGLIRVVGDGLTGAQLSIFDKRIPFFEADGAFYGFVAVPFEQSIRTYDATLTVNRASAPPLPILFPLDVESGGFLQQDVTLREDQLELIEPEVELEEFAFLDALTDDYTETWYGASGFAPPAETDLTSPYGAVRVFNELLETRHTGWDYVGDTGQILRAVADGRVVFSGLLPIRGGYVLIDHGGGVYSGYAHLSVRRAAVGQIVRQGQAIGLAGSTGRSSSPHLHVEMRVNNLWVDPVDFINMWTP